MQLLSVGTGIIYQLSEECVAVGGWDFAGDRGLEAWCTLALSLVSAEFVQEIE